MTATRRRAKPATITCDDTSLRFTSLIYGPVRVVSPELRRLGIPWMYDNFRHAYKVPKARADDLFAALDVAGCDVQMSAGWS